LTLDRQPGALPVFVTRWVDYSGKYGLAYQLSNSFAGMFFNDSTSIVLSSEDQRFSYLSATGETISGTVGQHPTDLEKKIKLTLRYKTYMADNLQSIEQPSAIHGEATRVFVTEFRRASNAVLFRLSDNVFQVHVRIA
jgi:beta-xylosidase